MNRMMVNLEDHLTSRLYLWDTKEWLIRGSGADSSLTDTGSVKSNRTTNSVNHVMAKSRRGHFSFSLYEHFFLTVSTFLSLPSMISETQVSVLTSSENKNEKTGYHRKESYKHEKVFSSQRKPITFHLSQCHIYDPLQMYHFALVLV